MTLSDLKRKTKLWAKGEPIGFKIFYKPYQRKGNAYPTVEKICTKCGQITMRAEMIKRPVCFDCKRRNNEDRQYGI